MADLDAEGAVTDDVNPLAAAFASQVGPGRATIPPNPATAGAGGEDVNPFALAYGSASPTPPASTMRDVGRGMAGGALATLGSIAGAGEYLFGSGGMASSARTYLEGAAQNQFSQTSEGFQRGLQREFLPGGDGPSAWESPGALAGAIGSQAVTALPSMLASILPAGLAARIMTAAAGTMAGTATAGVVAGGMTGAMTGGATWQGISDAWRTAPAEEVRQSPIYQRFYESSTGTPEERDRMARELSARESRPYAPLIAGAIGAAAGALLEAPLAAQLARRELAFLQGVRQGATREAGQEFIEGVAQEGAQQGALNDPSGLNRPLDPMEVARQGVQGAVVGGVVGGAVGGLGGLVRRPPAATPQGNTQEPPPEAPPAPPAIPPGVDPAVAVAAQESQVAAPAPAAPPAPSLDPAVAAAATAASEPSSERVSQQFVPGIGMTTVVMPPAEPLPQVAPSEAPPVTPPAQGVVAGALAPAVQPTPPLAANPPAPEGSVLPPPVAAPAAPSTAIAPQQTATVPEAAPPSVEAPPAAPPVVAAPPAPPAPKPPAKTKSEAAAGPRLGKKDLAKAVLAERVVTEENIAAREKVVTAIMARDQSKRRERLQALAKEASEQQVPVPAWVAEGLEIAERGRGAAAEGNTERWAAWAAKHGEQQKTQIAEAKAKVGEEAQTRRDALRDVFNGNPPSEAEVLALGRKATGDATRDIAARKQAIKDRTERLNRIDAAITKMLGAAGHAKRLEVLQGSGRSYEDIRAATELLNWLRRARQNAREAAKSPGVIGSDDLFYEFGANEVIMRGGNATGEIDPERVIATMTDMNAIAENKAIGTSTTGVGENSDKDIADDSSPAQESDAAVDTSDDALAEGLAQTDTEEQGVIQDEARQDEIVTLRESGDREVDETFDMTAEDAAALGPEGVKQVMERRAAYEESKKGRDRAAEVKVDLEKDVVTVDAKAAEERRAKVTVEQAKKPRAYSKEVEARLAALRGSALKLRGSITKRMSAVFGITQTGAERAAERMFDAMDRARSITMAGDADTRKAFFSARKGLRGVMDRTVMRTLNKAVGGNTMVVVLSDADWNRAWGKRIGEATAGTFAALPLEDVARDGVAGVVFFPERLLSESASQRREAFMHELVHAATEYSISRNRENRSRVDRLMAEVQEWVDANDVLGNTQQDEDYRYAMTNADEFVAMAMSNQRMQNLLKRVTLDASQRERLGLTGRVATAWDAFVQAVRKFLGLPNGTTTALEGIIEIVGESMASPDYNVEVARRLIKAGEESDALLRPMLNTSKGLDNLRRSVGDASINASDLMKKAGPVMATMRQLELLTKDWWTRTARMAAYANERFNPIQMLSRAVLSQSQRAEQILADEFNTVLSRFADVPQARRDAISALLVDSTMANVHPDVPITDAKNKHIAKSTSATAKQSRARHADLEKRFNALIAPDRKLFLDIVDMTRQGHERLIHSITGMLLDQWWDQRAGQSVNPKNPLPMPMSRADFEAMRQRFLDGKESNADQKAVDEAVYALIAKARERAKIEGVYVPLQRVGDYVVRWQTRDNPVLEYATEAELDAEIMKARENVLDRSRKRVVYDAAGKELDDDALKADANYKLMERALITVATGRLPATATQEDKDKATREAVKEARKQFLELALKRGGREAWRAQLVTQGVSFYDTKAEAVRRVEELKAQGLSGIKQIDLRDNPRDAVGMLDAELQRLIAAVEKDDQLDSDERSALSSALARALVVLTPSKALEAAQIKRKGVQGASLELERVLANYATANANYVAANEHQLDIKRALQAMAENIRTAADPASQTPENRVIAMRRVEQELRTRTTRDALDPMAVSDNMLEGTIRKVQSVAFLYYLVSPAYSMIQMLQPYMLSAPILAGRYGAKGVSALGRAMSDLGMGAVLAGGVKEAGRALKTFVTKGGVGQSADIFQIARHNIAKAQGGADLVRMLDELQKEGLVGNSTGLEVIRTLKARDGVLGTNLAKAEAFGRAIPGSIEVINRVGTAVAAYRLARGRGQTHEQATDYAREVVDQSQADYSAANTSRFMRPSNLTLRAVTSPMMTFRKYAQAVYTLLGSQAYMAFKGGTKEERSAARRTLMGIMATHMAMAGALGLPTEGIFIALGAVALALGEDEPWDIEKELRNIAADTFGAEAAELLMRGLPRAFGMDLSNRVGLDSLIFMKDMRDYQPASVTGYMGDLILGAPGGIAQRWLQVPGLLRDGEIGKAFEAAVPKGLSDIAKAARISEEGITTRRGERIDGNYQMSTAETIMQALGVSPSAAAEVYERRNAVQGENRRLTKERNDLLRRWRQAEPGERSRIWNDEVRPWNEQLRPELRQSRITMANLQASLREQTRRARESEGQDYLPRNRTALRDEGRFAVVPTR